ncbi:hypothetical protein CRE_24695 [Caenorhabditis remanei]|uniref:RING-type domain-containing protein n=1 Tax=Caenorhabditis remanei TaxID=31234 RepID=E3N3V4_CAERE|nr:hypothetical protein CRE_24695 [Caenorhabditis remanei]
MKNKKKPQEKNWEDLPKSRVIKVLEKSVYQPSSAQNDYILLNSLERKFRPDYEQLLGQKAILFHKNASKNALSLYLEAEPQNQSPWKGTRMYIPGTFVEDMSLELEAESRFLWLLIRLCKDTKSLTSAGIFLLYECYPPDNMRVNFYLQSNKIFNSILDYLPKMASIFKQKIQIILKTIIQCDQIVRKKQNRENKNESTAEADLLNEETSDSSKQRRQEDLNFERFFDLCKVYKKKYSGIIPKYKIDVDSLNFNLMPYQTETVRWMMHREAEGTVDENLSWMFKCEQLPNNPSFFYYPCIGAITRNQLSQDEYCDLAKRYTLKGGILSDEMGLGKTVQVLSLISSHRRGDTLDTENNTKKKTKSTLSDYKIADQVRIAESSFAEMNSAKNNSTLITYNASDYKEGETIACSGCAENCSVSICGWDFEKFKDEEFYCPDCRNYMPRKPVKTTLVIVPESLIFQWFTEIAKHCSDNFRVMFYFGVKKHGYLQALEMENYDVILTTYDTLRKELIFTKDKEQRRSLRNGFKPLHLTSSFMHVSFWRVIVDESQVMPQSINSNLLQMILKIEGDNWWCVTGTPLVRTVADMSPLFSFLGLFPFNNADFFSHYVHPQYLSFALELQSREQQLDEQNLPHILLLEILARIMSRKTKKDVDLQINLPELTEIEKKIRFSEVEERQYKEEKERLRFVVEKAIGKAIDSAHLADLSCRDKVLQELRTLRETVLTGQNNSSDLGSAGFVYAPETVIFRLVRNKKIGIENHVRTYMNHALGLAGAQHLMLDPVNALSVYEHCLSKFAEVVSSTCMEDQIGPEVMLQLKAITSFSDSPRTNLFDGDDEVDEANLIDEKDSDNKDELDRIRKIAGIVRNVKQTLHKYTKKVSNPSTSTGNVENFEEKHEELTNDSDDLPGPSEAKRARFDNETENSDEKDVEMSQEALEPSTMEQSAEEANDEYEEHQRRKHANKMALTALKPIRMDATQEFHMFVNMRKIQNSLGVPEENRIPLSRVEMAANRCIKLEVFCTLFFINNLLFQKQAAETISNVLNELTDIWANDDKNMIHQIREFFEMMRAHCAIRKDTEALYERGTEVREEIKKDHFPNLPYVALYDTNKLKPNKIKHHTKRCMGRCSKFYLECEMFIGQPCLKLSDIINKTMNQIVKIDDRRKTEDVKLKSCIQIVMEMSDPNLLLDLIEKKEETKTAKEKRMLEILSCEHKLIKGTREQQGHVQQYYHTDHPCEICDTWCKLSLFFFDSGFSSYHGEIRPKSGVYEFATLLVNNYSPGRKEAQMFSKHYLRPFFERIHDMLKTLQNTTGIFIELVDRYKELSQAQTLLTDNQICAWLGDQDEMEIPMEMKREQYAASHLANRNDSLQAIQKDVKELRYLTNLVKKQFSDENEEFEECPICQSLINSFMVFTCGHRICPECFDRLKVISRHEPHGYGWTTDSIQCPSCRIRNRSQQIMLARSGYAERDSIIPGVVLSVKVTLNRINFKMFLNFQLSAAIQIMREILDTDSSNKIIVFTSVEPSSTTVWNYLQKIFKLAKLPFSATSRYNCGKKIVDFEVSEDVKILLCSLSLCANGLNMTGANHIIFLDPPHLQSVLNQAIGRINRFGQKRAMRVIHLVVEGSLDSELREIAKNTYRQEDEKKGWTIGDIRAMFNIDRD